jgi:DNA ligase-1
MEKFAALFDKIDQTQSTNEKVFYLKEYFEEVSAADGAWALFFLSGNRLKRLISSRDLFNWCLELTKIPEWLAAEAYGAVGDTAETVALLLPNTPQSHVKKWSLAEWIEQRILPLRKATEEEKKQKIFTFWNQLSSKERFILNKILTGSFRVGVSHLLTIRGLSQALQIPTELLSLRLMGHWEPTAQFFEALKNPKHKGGGKSLNPYPFYLASPLDAELETLGSPEEWLAEWKWDGIRGQGIRRGEQVAIWSRGNELISDQFPEILESLLKIPDQTVLDGEILAYQGGAPLSFASLQKRLGRKKVSKSILEEVPLVFMIYDLLEYEGKDLRSLSLKQRRSIFESWTTIDPHITVSPQIVFNQWKDIYEERLAAKAKLTEGVMLKKWDSPYGVGRQRGAWWKYKVDPMTIDAVLIYAQAGSGRRANLYTDYTFGVWHENELIPIAKAYSGLSQEEIDRLDHWIRRHTEEKFGPARKVKAELVFEIAFEGIQESKRHKSGVALRFPRISRWRTDKPIEECDTLENIKKTFLNP